MPAVRNPLQMLKRAKFGDVSGAPISALDAAITDARQALTNSQTNAQLVTSQMAVSAQQAGAAMESAKQWHQKVKSLVGSSPQDAAVAAISRNVSTRQAFSDKVKSEVQKNAAFQWTVAVGMRRKAYALLLSAYNKRSNVQPYEAEVNAANQLSDTADTLEASAAQTLQTKPPLALDDSFSQRRINDIANRYGVNIDAPGAGEVVPTPNASLLFDSDAERQRVSQLFPFTLPAAFQRSSTVSLSGYQLLGLGDDTTPAATDSSCDFWCNAVKTFSSIGGKVGAVLSSSSASTSDPNAKGALAQSGSILTGLNSIVNGAVSAGKNAVQDVSTPLVILGLAAAAVGGLWLWSRK